MTLTHIAIFSLAGLIYLLLVPARLRAWALLLGSLFAVYGLQPAIPVRGLDFLLPSLTLALSVGVWVLSKKEGWAREDKLTLASIFLMILGISLTRYLIPELRPTPSRPPAIVSVFLGLVTFGFVLIGLNALSQRGRRVLVGGQILLLIVFIILKTEILAEGVSGFFRDLAGQSLDLASASDLAWLGFSYMAFRLLHVLRDAQMGTLPDVSLREHITFVTFFPAFTAGPIDRIERHIEDDRALASMNAFDVQRITEGLGRMSLGIFKKFVVADTLALVALNATNAEQALSAGDTWFLLYAYSLRLYFDFSGYSDIAIGIGRLFGIYLPENFKLPYLKNNITAFWQSWHITLSDWVRFYVFSPLSRALLRRKPRPDPRLIVFASLMATMILIGLWHGISPNFFIWGVWHGLGLFVHKLWSDRTRKWFFALVGWRKTLWALAGTLLTFHFVTLGWVWFGIADFDIALQTLLKLFGVG